jgi:hypothetical protein
MKTNPNLLVALGAIAGGVLGYLIFWMCLREGFVALALPGGLVGFGAGMSKGNSIVLCVLCGIAALALGLFTEWHFFPFIADDGLPYFLSHFYQLPPITLIMLGIGGFIGFWAPYRRIMN